MSTSQTKRQVTPWSVFSLAAASFGLGAWLAGTTDFPFHQLGFALGFLLSTVAGVKEVGRD